MNITIGTIRIHAITSIGSLNIGKTIICRNHANTAWSGAASETTSEEAAQQINGEEERDGSVASVSLLP